MVKDGSQIEAYLILISNGNKAYSDDAESMINLIFLRNVLQSSQFTTKQRTKLLDINEKRIN